MSALPLSEKSLLWVIREDIVLSLLIINSPQSLIILP